MIIDGKNKDKALELLNEEKFNHPIVIDTLNLFKNSNPNLPLNYIYQTFLLDSSNEVLVIGNPHKTPKLQKLHENVIMGDLSSQQSDPYDVKPFKTDIIATGPVKRTDTIYQSFYLRNDSNVDLHIHSIRPSCHCISVFNDIDKVPAGDVQKITIRYIPNSENDEFKQSVDIFFKEREKPYRLVIHGVHL